MICFQVNTLALKGGVDIRECVWRIMHAMFTNSLARTINMRGINGKIGFQCLRLRNVVIGKLALILVVPYLLYFLDYMLHLSISRICQKINHEDGKKTHLSCIGL